MIDFEQLRRAVTELNQETDTLNEEIRDFEDSLANIGAGCEAWLPRACNGYDLGYAKLGGKWCVAIRRQGDEPSSLLRAPREIRIAACEHLAELASTILTVVENRVIDVRRARRIVKGIGK